MTSKHNRELILIKASLGGKNLKKLLRQKGMTITELAKGTKISRQTFYNWIKRIKEPNDEISLQVARYLGLIEPVRAERERLRREIREFKNQIKKLGKK
jgi:transcriptional regulator with XRE-family HTH domain